MELEEKVIIETLQRLKLSKDYQYLTWHLKNIKKIIDTNIYNEDLEHKNKEVLIIKSNLINNFINLPDDLLKQF